MQRIAAGDSAALAALYDALSPRVFGLCKMILNNRADAEEALQDVFVHVWNEAKGYDQALSSPVSWVLMIARSRAIDRLRRRGTQQRADALRKDAATDTAPSERIAEMELDPRVARALAALPKEQAEAVGLAYFRGMSREQIAELQNVPVGTVKTRIRLGVMRLRDELGEAT